MLHILMVKCTVFTTVIKRITIQLDLNNTTVSERITTQRQLIIHDRVIRSFQSLMIVHMSISTSRGR